MRSASTPIAAALEEVAALPDPVGEVIERSTRPNGLKIRRVRVPLGVVFFIYESRPNVTADAAALCVKSGNAVILRGGKEALHSNLALHRLLAETLARVRAAAGRRPTRRHDRPRRRRAVPQAERVHRRHDSARRQVADRARRGRSDDARHQALRRRLPRLRRQDGRPGDGREDPDQQQGAAAGRVQRGRVVPGPPRCRIELPEVGRARRCRRRASRSAATRESASWFPQRSRRRRRTTAPSTST